MLKPLARLERANNMRHLSVPSKETAHWRQHLLENGWLAEGLGIHNLGEMRGIPLSAEAPDSFDGLSIVEIDPLSPGPRHWTERLDRELFATSEEWPMSHDEIGDVIILKIPESLQNHSKEIGEAILMQHPKARLVCADEGVKGEFRVRKLSAIAGEGTTLTRVREHGYSFWADPGAAYYSPRLANERAGTLTCARKLSEALGRAIDVCDPYAGVGPAIVPLIGEANLIASTYASDLNPAAVEILKTNVEGWVECRDARTLSQEIPECCDMLLVNLPHQFLDHLPHLLGLLKKGHEVVIRGWAILPNSSLNQTKEAIENHLNEWNISSIDLTPNRSYSPTESYTNIEIHLLG